MSFNLPNSYLLGVILVASTHSGPQLVFNYPSVLSHELANKANTAKTMIDYEISDNDSDVAGDDAEDEYIENSEEKSDRVFEDLKWNARNLNYYMGTKKDLLSFLDEQEKHRERKEKESVATLTSKRLKTHLGGHSGGNLDLNANMLAHSHGQTLRKSDSDSISRVKSLDVDSIISPGMASMSNSTPIINPYSGVHNSPISQGTPINSSTSHPFASPMASPTTGAMNSSSGKYAGSSTSSNGITNTIFGIDHDSLCDTLCPPKQMCNSRFEILIDDLVFLGLPVHCYDNGTWRKKSKKTMSRKLSGNMREVDIDANGTAEEIDALGSTGKSTTMNMFHLVFVMNPPIIETNYRIDEMFHYVISRLSLVLRYEQLKNDYVWQQIKIVQRLKEEFRTTGITSNVELALYLLQKSSLCKMMADCFESISKSEIANLSINNKLRSFQIPIKTEFHSLPERTVPYLPGSHLSSTVSMLSKTGLINVGDTTRYGQSNIMNNIMMGGDGGSGRTGMATGNGDDDEDFEGDESDVSGNIIYFALLLLDDPESIISDIKTEDNSALATFIRMIKPTESLNKLSEKLESTSSSSYLSISEIKSFAFHLIYWRRARVITPLNSRSVYILSPMAPVTLNLYDDIRSFSEQFTTLPSLPHFLKLLSSTSSKPKQYANIIPSRDHHGIYLQALGWLIRYGYVTQLHTFIWLKISRKVKMKVEEDLENESSLKKRGGSKKRSSLDSSSKTTNMTTAASSKAVPASDNTSKDSENITSLVNGSNDLSSNSSRANLAFNVVLEEDSDTIILDPDRASTLERRWISKIVTDECHLSPELTTVFYKLLKYMNGKNSLELLLLKEDISRNELRKLLYAIEDHIISVKHW